MWLSIKRLGWVWKGPFELVTDEGVVLSMVRNSPAGIGQEVKAAHFRAHLAAVAVRAGLPREKGICLNPIWDALSKKGHWGECHELDQGGLLWGCLDQLPTQGGRV